MYQGENGYSHFANVIQSHINQQPSYHVQPQRFIGNSTMTSIWGLTL
jgi:hypothetical protein